MTAECKAHIFDQLIHPLLVNCIGLCFIQQVKEFYQFWEGHQEAWDGPALLVWSDGKHVGACLDRNGLRPARYMTLKDGTVLMMSETGVVPVDESEVCYGGVFGCGGGACCM